MRWFRNIRSGQPFDPGQISLGVSIFLRNLRKIDSMS
jgi:hypothetical protein